MHNRLQIGIESNPAADEIGPLFNLFLLTETEKRPAFYLGTSSDRIGSPPGKQAYYGTVSKYLPLMHVSVYVGLNYTEWDESYNAPFGGTVELGRGYSVRTMYDGERTHLLINYFAERFGISLMYIWLETPGISVFMGL